MTTQEAIAYLNTRTACHAIVANGYMVVFTGNSADADVLMRMFAATDELMAQMVMAFIEIYEQNKTGATT